MFLTQVYKYNKWLFSAMLFFAIGQLFVNYKRGLVATPFFHYGMYSHKINIEKEYEIIEVEVNGKMLRGEDFAPHTWDKILLPVVYFINIQKSNQLYDSDIRRLTSIVHLPTNEKYFLQHCDVKTFEIWYKKYLQKIIGKSINNCNVLFHNYHFTNSILQPTDSIKSLPLLCN